MWTSCVRASCVFVSKLRVDKLCVCVSEYVVCE